VASGGNRRGIDTGWDVAGGRDAVRAWVVETIGDEQAVLVVDETGFVKKGTHSAGVKRQYRGTAGRIENSQVGVFLAYTHGNDYALIDRELYLPKEWEMEPTRRAAAKIPETVGFATKGVLARTMLKRAFSSKIRFGWVTADSIYGNDGQFGKLLEDQNCSYVLTVGGSHLTWKGVEQVRVDAVTATLPTQAWQRLSCGTGSKGARIDDWACVPLPRPLENPAFQAGLLVRRSLTDAKLTYYLTFAASGGALHTLISVTAARWKVEEYFELARQEVGLADYEVRHYLAWYRHITLAMLALAFLTVVRRAVVLDERPKKRHGRPPALRSRHPTRATPSAQSPHLDASSSA